MILHFLDHTGDTQVDTLEDLDLASQLFSEAMEAGKMAYAIPTEGYAVMIRSLDEAPETTERIVIRPVYAGG